MPPVTALVLAGNPGSGSADLDAVRRGLRHRVGALRLVEVADIGPSDLEGADRVAVAGGDGSIAPVAELAGRAGKPLAVIPAGTANDFARAFGLPDDLDEACRLAAEGERLRRLDLGRAGERPFLNVASAGLPPVAARRAEGMKRALGPLAYAVGALRAGATARALRCRLDCDGSTLHEGDAWQVTIACSGAFGGGSSVRADPADGSLDAVAIPAGSRLALAWRAYGLRSGRLERQDEVVSSRCAEAVLEAAGPISLNVDGEVVRLGPRVRFGVEPGAFELVVG